MKIVDEACAWLIFLAGVVYIVLLEMWRWRGGAIDTGLLYIFLAMFNLLRVRASEATRLIIVFSLAANVAGFILEIVRWNVWGISGYLVPTVRAVTLIILLLVVTMNSIADFLRLRTMRVPAVRNCSEASKS